MWTLESNGASGGVVVQAGSSSGRGKSLTTTGILFYCSSASPPCLCACVCVLPVFWSLSCFVLLASRVVVN
jgi:hypothetical protein